MTFISIPIESRSQRSTLRTRPSSRKNLSSPRKSAVSQLPSQAGWRFSPILTSLGLPASPETFIGNAASVILTSFATMPLFIIWFGWWHFPKSNLSSNNIKGCAILAALFVLEAAIFWNLLPS